MEEIKIYHSVWRMLLMSIGCLAFAVNGCMLLQSPRTNHVIVWIGIIFFGLGGIVLLYWLIKERLTGQPFLTITDDCIICNGGWKKYVIRFADVESFVLLSGRQNNIIGIHYKKGVERQKMEETSIIGRLARKFNLEVSGTQESISVSGVSIKAQELCNILNKRLQK